MVQIDVVYEGDLRCRATHGPSGTELVTDPPTDNQGRGESFSPTDLCATALGTCMLSIMAIMARKNGWAIEGTRVRIVKRMVADPRRRIGEIEVRVQVPGDPPPEVRAALEEAARTCPVALSLNPAVRVPVEFEWGGAGERTS